MPRRNTVAKVNKQVVTLAGGPPELLTVKEAAELLRLTKSTLDKWRTKGVGPKFIYVGRLVRYARPHLAEYTAQSTRTSTSQREVAA
jgi:excisionase family DNA binding protein